MPTSTGYFSRTLDATDQDVSIGGGDRDQDVRLAVICERYRGVRDSSD